MAEVNKILVGVDLSDHSRRALDYALLLAEKCKAELIVVNVLDVFDIEGETEKKMYQIKAILNKNENIGKYVDEAKKSGVPNIKTKVTKGDPAERILMISRREKPDMIVLGSRGLSPAKEFLLGSVSHKITHHANCPVLIVR